MAEPPRLSRGAEETPGSDVAEEEEEGEEGSEGEGEGEAAGEAAPLRAPPSPSSAPAEKGAMQVSQLKALFQKGRPEAPPPWPASASPRGAPQKPCMLPVRCPAPRGPPEAPRPPPSRREEQQEGAEEAAGGGSPYPRRVGAEAGGWPGARVPLEAAEHEWMVRCSAGRWSPQLHGLLLRDGGLAAKGDFLTGFTALHWAAKSGSCEALRGLMEAAGRGAGGPGVDVNARSHGGYTPLHVAAIHGREEAVALLVRDYGARVTLRDYSGRRPFQYLREGASFAARHLLRDPRLRAAPAAPPRAAPAPAPAAPLKRTPRVAASLLSTTGAALGLLTDDAAAFYELTRGLKKPASFHRLLNAATAPRRKAKARAASSSYSALSEAPEEEEPEEESSTGTGTGGTKRRPVSELFFGHI